MIVVGRLRPDVSCRGRRVGDARDRERGWRSGTRRRTAGAARTSESLHTLLVGDVRAPLYIVMGAVALLLLIACANVANLQLSHAVARRREMSVRAALGAGRQRLARQLLTESVILSAIGGVARCGRRVRRCRRAGQDHSDRPHVLQPDQRRRARDGVCGARRRSGTGVVFGLAPALHASRTNLNDALATRTGGLAARVGRVEIRGVFVVAQIALSVVLLVGAGLLARTLVKLQQVDLGFDTSNLFTMEFRLPATKYTEPRQISDFFTRAIDGDPVSAGRQERGTRASRSAERQLRRQSVRRGRRAGTREGARADASAQHREPRLLQDAAPPAGERARRERARWRRRAAGRGHQRDVRAARVAERVGTRAAHPVRRLASSGSPSSVSLAMRSTSGHRTNRARRRTSRTCRHRRSSRASSSARIATRWRSRPPCARPSGVWIAISLCGRSATMESLVDDALGSKRVLLGLVGAFATRRRVAGRRGHLRRHVVRGDAADARSGRPHGAWCARRRGAAAHRGAGTSDSRRSRS